MRRFQAFVVLVLISLAVAPIALAGDGNHWLGQLVTWIFDTLGAYVSPDG